MGERLEVKRMSTNRGSKTVSELDRWQVWLEKKVMDFNSLKVENFAVMKPFLSGRLVKKWKTLN